MEWWKVFAWGSPILLIGIFIALCVWLPAVAIKIVDVIAKVLGFLLGYRIGCALLAAIVVGFAVDYWRHSKDDAEFAAERARASETFRQAQKARDADIAAKTRAEVYQQLEQDAADDAKTDKEVKDFTDALPVPHTDDMPKVPVAAPQSWIIGPADACRLRRIAGDRRAQCGSRSDQGLPKAGPRATHPANRGG